MMQCPDWSKKEVGVQLLPQTPDLIIIHRGKNMAKGRDAQKTEKKKSEKTLKEKRKEKKEKKSKKDTF
jgi:hypothetical protein